MCVHDAEHAFKYSVFKIIVMLNMNSNFFWFSNFLLVGGRLIGGRCIWSVVGWSVVDWSVGRWSVIGGRLVGGFKETLFFTVVVEIVSHIYELNSRFIEYLAIINVTICDITVCNITIPSLIGGCNIFTNIACLALGRIMFLKGLCYKDLSYKLLLVLIQLHIFLCS